MLVSTHRIHSTPSSTLPRLLATFPDIVDLNQLKVPKSDRYQKAFETALEKSNTPTVAGHMEADREQEVMLFSKLPDFQGMRLVVTNGVAPDRSPVAPGRTGSDLFHPMNYITDGALLYVADKLVREGDGVTVDDFGSNLFMAGGIGDWPALMFEHRGRVGIGYPFPFEIGRLERRMIAKGKEGYGSIVRFFNDERPLRGNSQYSEGVLDYQTFKAIRDARPHIDRDAILEAGGRQEYYKSEQVYIHLIRKLVLQKNVRFLQQLKPRSIHIYAVQGSATMDIWSRAADIADVTWKPVGGDNGLLDGAKTVGRAELNPIAIGRLEGMFATWYNQSGKGRIEPQFRISIPKRSFSIQFRGCPWEAALLCDKTVGCGGPSYILDRNESCLKTDADSLPVDQKQVIIDFAKLTATGVMPIEGYINALNQNDNALGFEDKQWKSWILERGDGIVVPFRLDQIPGLKEGEYGIRISDLSYPIKLEDFLTKSGDQIASERQMKLAQVADALVRGTLWHTLIFEGEQSVYSDLLHQDFRMSRADYCDVGEERADRKHLVYRFTPTSTYFDLLGDKVDELATRRKNPVNVRRFLDFLYDLRLSSPDVVLFGHADSTAQIYRPDLPEQARPIVIIDGKTSSLSPYGNPNILNQELGYGHAVRQMHQNKSSSMVAVTLHPRYTPNRQLPPELQDKNDYGLYLQMVPSMNKVYFGNPQDIQFHAAALQQYAGRKFVGIIT